MGTTVDFTSLSLHYLYFLTLQKEKELQDPFKIEIIFNVDARRTKGRQFTPITARLGNFSQHNIFLCQLALFGGGEELSLFSFERFIKEFQRIKALKFSDYRHEISLKFVLDLKASWNMFRIKNFEVDVGEDGKIETKLIEGETYCRQGCIFCSATRSCTNGSCKNVIFFKVSSFLVYIFVFRSIIYVMNIAIVLIVLIHTRILVLSISIQISLSI